ncbi:unnamed protein product [Cylicocyclus nassatus]|uniref:Uncharacterized protein n=1 Tax=Cylicocyclus nassatus TaxID=53992 RepID=A0AA36HEW5_CYLNA|nr:unnamed protein product [Cylicocyclus nassatus]
MVARRLVLYGGGVLGQRSLFHGFWWTLTESRALRSENVSGGRVNFGRNYGFINSFKLNVPHFADLYLVGVHFLSCSPIYNVDHLKDSWTVVTGGTDGIGRAYIEELAKSRGLRKFYLIGRNRQKLDQVVKELQERYEAECKTAVFDFECDSYDKLPQELKDMDVGILINCAGIAPTQVANFIEMPEGTASRIFQVNLMSNVKMLELVLPGMIKRNKGCVVNVSSMTGWRPLPYISAYPASKAAISFFSDCLSDEFRHTNVRIQCLIPMLVATKVASYDVHEANNLFVVTPENYARQAVRALGRFEMITGCVQHDIQIALGTLLSFWVFKLLYVPIIMLGIHKDRVAAYQKSHSKVA